MKTQIAKERMSASAKARCTQEWRKMKSESYRTQINDEQLKKLYADGHTQVEVAEIMGISRKVVFNAMHRLKIKTRVRAKRDQQGEKNSTWKGSDANLISKHRRLYRMFGQPTKCDVCGTTDESKTYDWANLTGDYDNPSDFKRMCRSCHCKYDKKHINFKGLQCGL